MTINQVMQTFVILMMLPIVLVSMEMYLKKCVMSIFVLHNLFVHKEDTIMHQKVGCVLLYLRWQRDIDKICDKIVQLF